MMNRISVWYLESKNVSESWLLFGTLWRIMTDFTQENGLYLQNRFYIGKLWPLKDARIKYIITSVLREYFHWVCLHSVYLKNLNCILYSDHLPFLVYPFIVSHPDYSCHLQSETQFVNLVISTLQSCLLTSVCLKQKVCSHNRDTSYFLIQSKQFLN